MLTKFRSNRKNEFIYQTIKTFIIFFCFLFLINWFTADEIYLGNTIMFALWMTGAGVIPIVLTLKISGAILHEKRQVDVKMFLRAKE